MLYYGKPSEVPPPTPYGQKIRERPFLIPFPQTSETAFDYVCTLKNDSPIEYYTLGGITFAKRIYPNEKSLAENQEKVYSHGIPTVKLTPSQYAAMQKEIDSREVYVFKQNSQLREAKKLSSLLVLCKVCDFHPVSESLETFYDGSTSKSRSKEKNKQL